MHNVPHVLQESVPDVCSSGCPRMIARCFLKLADVFEELQAVGNSCGWHISPKMGRQEALPAAAEATAKGVVEVQNNLCPPSSPVLTLVSTTIAL
eukprot:6163622-Amphidinium_carterae.1